MRCLIGVTREARAKPILHLLEDIRLYMMERVVKKKELINSWNDTLCQRIRQRLEKNKDNHRSWSCTHNGDQKFELKQINSSDRYVVDMKRKQCTCGLWELSGIPCCHAVSAIYFVHDNPDNYVNGWFRVERAKKAYQFHFELINGERLWERSATAPLMPPKNRRLPGRPKKKRRRESHEGPKKTRVSKSGTQMSCSKCKQPGHNVNTCKGEQLVTRARSSYKKQRSDVGESTENARPYSKKQRTDVEGGTTSIIRNRKKVIRSERPPCGLGVYASPDGRQFVKLPGQNRGKWIPSGSAA